LFRPVLQSFTCGNLAGATEKVTAGRQATKSSNTINSQDIELLNRLFHTKTSYDVRLDCDEDAKQLLQASQTDPLIRHALLSLRALREDFNISRVHQVVTAPQAQSHEDGVQHYCMALRGLASHLSVTGSNSLKSALLCCQMFISIEQVKENYTAMIQHLIQGLRIMHEYRARPRITATEGFAPAHHDRLPLLDVFVIKLFIAPCKFANEQIRKETSGNKASACTTPAKSSRSGNLRPLAPDIKAKLTKIATSTLTFLENVAQVKTPVDAVTLLLEKTSLLDKLDIWLVDLGVIQAELDSSGHEHLSVTFKRLFHQILKVVILGTLECSLDLEGRLWVETGRLLDMASYVTDGVKMWRNCGQPGVGVNY
jgi:hypothetical protein